MAQRVAGDQYESITGQLFEIGRQLRQKSGYPYDPGKLQRHLQMAIEGDFGDRDRIPALPTWKTIVLGICAKSGYDLYELLVKDGCHVSEWADDLLKMKNSAFSVSSEQLLVDLVKVSVAELGFHSGAKTSDIYKAAQKRGLVLCPSEVGPQLRRQYVDQPRDEWILVGMEPIADSDGDLRVFGVAHGDDGRWLGGHFGHPSFVWDGGSVWVFVRPRK